VSSSPFSNVAFWMRGFHQPQWRRCCPACGRFSNISVRCTNFPSMTRRAFADPRSPSMRSRLTKDEVQRFLQSIPTHTFTGLRDRALIEILYASGMRISEALSLDRQQIDWEKQEARIIGKGKKPRKVYFTQGALRWLQDYLAYRHDDHPALFIIQSDQPKRLEAHGTWRRFRRYATRAGLSKRVYPHMLRHTMATTLLANGCPIGHIKALLGHEHLTTTCKYYLGIISDAEAKAAHGKYISYKTETSQETDGPLQGSENIGAE
jgi:site-specific recombinase XerD